MVFDINRPRQCYCCTEWLHILKFQTPQETYLNICHSCMEKYSLTRADEKRIYAVVSTNNDRTNPPGTITFAYWVEMLEQAQGNCSYCGKQVGRNKLVLDHIEPLAGGGKNSNENIAPACTDCNSRKRCKSAEDWKRYVCAVV